jgi:regulator of replication initiation timing
VTTLTIKHLQAVVKRTLDEERATEALKLEIRRVLGPAVITEGKLEEVAASANAWMDVLDRTGRSSRFDFVSQVTTGFLDHNSPEVRQFAARVVPERFLSKMTRDVDSRVRHIVASRVPLATVREMLKRFKNDDELRLIYVRRAKQSKLHEAGVTQPKVEPLGHDPGLEGRLSEPMGDSSKTQKDMELSEAWYHQQAWRLMHDYGRNIEYAWEELAVRRFCSSIRATSLVEIDAAKLLKHVKDIIKEKEELAMERNALRETLDWLEKQAKQEDMLTETALPELDEVDDPVRKLYESGSSPEQYIEQALVLFRIQQGNLPTAIRKYRIGEGNTKVTAMPVIGYLPHGGGFRAIDERALDRFCEHWTRRQAVAGEPIKLQWTTHPTDLSKVGFSASLS